MTRSLRTSAVCPAAVLLALVMGNGPALARQAGKQAPEAKPTARISMPWNNSLVRAKVPVFGVASARHFKLYRVEFGRGRRPEKWHVVKVSTVPRQYDPWAAQKVRWNPSTGAKGNLATWDTGLTSYRYFPQPKRNLNGVYTLRLVVEDTSGNTAEARVVVTVARAVTRLTGGIVESCDGKAFLNVPKGGIGPAFMLASIQPVDPVQNPAPINVKAPTGLTRVGEIYEFRPPLAKLTKPASFRLCYGEKGLVHTNSRGERTKLPETKLGIYAYHPVKDTWAPVDGSRAHPGTNEVRAPLREVTQYVALYALMADVTPPAPPALDVVAKSTERRVIAISGRTEPLVTLELWVGPAAKVAAKAGSDGAFSIPAVPLAVGENVLSARSIDAAGNRSKTPSIIKVTRVQHPPRAVERVEIPGKLEAEQADRFLVRVAGEDSHPGTNTTYARVASATDLQGIELELVETGPKTGVYEARFSVGKETDTVNNAIAALRHNEKITVVSQVDKRKRASIKYVDTLPPLAPEITSPTHPCLRQDTFEDAANPTGEWKNVGGKHGAGLSLQSSGATTYLKLVKRNGMGHLGAMARSTPYEADTFPVVSFDYLLNPNVKVDLEVASCGWQLVEFNETGREDPISGREVLGRFYGIVSDGRWHHAELNLASLIKARWPHAARAKVNGIRFINWDKVAYMKSVFGRTGSKGAYWCIDNFRILSYGGQDAVFNWLSSDENGVAGYSWLLDRKPNTTPPKTLIGTKTTARYQGLPDGRWYLHVRAVDQPGNWGPANHYMVIVDRGRPRAELALQSGAGGEPVKWDRPIHVKVHDGDGSGVDPRTIRLRVGGTTYAVGSDALTYDPKSKLLTFAPRNVRPHARMFADGERVGVELAAAGDHAGHPLVKPLRWSYVAKSPLKVTPPNPDGKNGWYVTPPRVEMQAPAGCAVAYEWLVTPEMDELFRKGNSINRLTVAVTDVRGKTRRYHKPLRLDTTVPSVRVVPRRSGVAGGADSLHLEHDDYVLERGGLTLRTFETADCNGTPLLAQAKAGLRAVRAERADSSRLRSACWTGWLCPPDSGVYRVFLEAGEKQTATLSINGEPVLDTAKATAWERQVDAEVLLRKRMLPIEIRWHAAKATPSWALDLLWQKGRDRPRSIPREALWARRSVATVFYRWDDGEERRYDAPLAIPRGRHTLHYYAVDEAGHRSKPGQFTVGEASR